MDIFKIFLCCLSISFFSNASILAQTTPQGMLNDINKQIADCKANIDKTQNRIAEIQATDPVTIYLENQVEEWAALEKELEAHQKCLKKAEDDLDWLKKWYPSLFNNPSVTLSEKDKNPDRAKPDPALKRLAEKAQSAFDSANTLLQQLLKQLAALKNK